MKTLKRHVEMRTKTITRRQGNEESTPKNINTNTRKSTNISTKSENTKRVLRLVQDLNHQAVRGQDLLIQMNRNQLQMYPKLTWNFILQLNRMVQSSKNR